MLKRFRSKMLKKKKSGAAEISVENRQAEALGDKIERYTEAITFAEAGLQETAQELMRAEEVEKTKVLVVTHDYTFSNPLVGYALGLAERMGYEIIALNVSPLGIQSSGVLNDYAERLQEEFKAKCEQTVVPFQDSCQDKGIQFTHLIRFGDVDHCIKEVHKEMRRVEFVITEPESCPEEGKVSIPVFCMAS